MVHMRAFFDSGRSASSCGWDGVRNAWLPGRGEVYKHAGCFDPDQADEMKARAVHGGYLAVRHLARFCQALRLRPRPSGLSRVAAGPPVPLKRCPRLHGGQVDGMKCTWGGLVPRGRPALHMLSCISRGRSGSSGTALSWPAGRSAAGSPGRCSSCWRSNGRPCFPWTGSWRSCGRASARPRPSRTWRRWSAGSVRRWARSSSRAAGPGYRLAAGHGIVVDLDEAARFCDQAESKLATAAAVALPGRSARLSCWPRARRSTTSRTRTGRTGPVNRCASCCAGLA